MYFKYQYARSYTAISEIAVWLAAVPISSI